MLRNRTKLLLVFMVLFGIGIAVLSSLADGLYSAICLFLLPLLVASAGASIIADFSQTNDVASPAVKSVTAQSDDRFDVPRAA
ncbi:MAG: hypothetical protein ACRD6N_12980 [Pyrinomonadaceae bacterium]